MQFIVLVTTVCALLCSVAVAISPTPKHHSMSAVAPPAKFKVVNKHLALSYGWLRSLLRCLRLGLVDCNGAMNRAYSFLVGFQGLICILVQTCKGLIVDLSDLTLEGIHGILKDSNRRLHIFDERRGIVSSPGQKGFSLILLELEANTCSHSARKPNTSWGHDIQLTLLYNI